MSRARLTPPLSSVEVTLGFLARLVSEESCFRFRDSIDTMSLAGESPFFACGPFLCLFFLSFSGRFSPSSKTSRGRS
jgi:hypothetical protein